MRRHLLGRSGQSSPQLGLRFVKAGLVDQAQAVLRIHSGGIDDIIEDVGRAAYELSFGDPERGVLRMRTALPRSREPFSSDYQNACELFANELLRLNRRSEAIIELERCVTASPRFSGAFHTAFWMKNQLRLADEYRATGRISDAEPIEQRLRRLLVYADPDNPLVVRLYAR